MYIPIDKDDIRFYNADFFHNQYLINALSKYTWGEQGRHLVQETIDQKEKIKYDEFFIALARSGIVSFSNVGYHMEEPLIKEALMYLPEEIRNSQITQMEFMQKALEEEKYNVGLMDLIKKEDGKYEFNHDDTIVYAGFGDKLVDVIKEQQKLKGYR